MIYVRKVFEHDVTHQVSIDQYVYEHFFHEREILSFTVHGDDVCRYEVNVRYPTDKRLGGQFKEICRRLHYQVDDLLVIKSLGNGLYQMSLIKPNSQRYAQYAACFHGMERHAILSEMAEGNYNLIYHH
ncbi:hypothetical protein [Fibrobacter sp. UWB7]|uniref:hypothetical protein n=1 Tax=Fibrobacter sp. UWB7 TaxID=1896206 RepID=UPI000933F20F|nr:hypothetical protein [Fibrobacter sp. UWB7]